jgi:hypothetical protein
VTPLAGRLEPINPAPAQMCGREMGSWVASRLPWSESARYCNLSIAEQAFHPADAPAARGGLQHGGYDRIGCNRRPRWVSALRISDRSEPNRSYAVLRSTSSVIRRIDEGCTIASMNGAMPLPSISLPRSTLTRNARPAHACAAVAPRQTITRSFMRQSRRAAISDCVGSYGRVASPVASR